ncbi:MAG: hypothetical protein QXK88_05500 [Desulfurococcaceae archaeon]
MRTQYKRKLIDSIESTVGDIINDLIDKYYGDRVETELEYERLIYSIARCIRREVFENNASLNEIIEYLNKLRTKKSSARFVLSYLIATALEEPD